MLSWILRNIIDDTFTHEVGKFQCKQEQPLGLLVDFSGRIDYDKYEDGYRHICLLIYGEMNYVAVVSWEKWNVLPIDADPDKDGYLEFTRGMKLWGYHDSCWRDGVGNFIKEYSNEFLGTVGKASHSWYTKHEMTDQHREMIRNLIDERDNQNKTL